MYPVLLCFYFAAALNTFFIDIPVMALITMVYCYVLIQGVVMFAAMNECFEGILEE